MLGECVETIYIVDDDEEAPADLDNVKTVKKQLDMLFVRGDSVVLISPSQQ